MPGGKGNIRPEDGKQFSSTYQPQEKWTEEKAIELAEGLIRWFNEKDDNGNDKGNIFWEEYIVIEKDLYPSVVSYLCNKFSSFSNLIEKAKKIQEIKLVKYGIADKLQPTMTIFVLKNHHNYRDKSEFTGKDGGAIGLTVTGIEYIVPNENKD